MLSYISLFAVVIFCLIVVAVPVPTFQDNGLCGLIASTNIAALTTYSKWTCSNFGNTTSNPCSPTWPGISCSGGFVANITIGNIALRGLNYWCRSLYLLLLWTIYRYHWIFHRLIKYNNLFIAY